MGECARARRETAGLLSLGAIGSSRFVYPVVEFEEGGFKDLYLTMQCR